MNSKFPAFALALAGAALSGGLLVALVGHSESGAAVPAVAEESAPPPVFDADRAMLHIRELAGTIGVRKAGTPGERQAAAYIAAQLQKMGLSPSTAIFPIPGGRTSRNVYAVIGGRRNGAGALNGHRYLIVGAHFDSKWPSPGANDNAGGVGVLLELGRAWKASPPPITVMLAFFGAEEIVDRNRDHHHYGSRYLAGKLRPGDGLIGMISVDQVGVGPNLHVRAMGKGPPTLRRQLLDVGPVTKIKATFLRDPGWSDHEPFERLGYPVAWLEWRRDPAGHTRKDTYRRVRRDRLESVGRWIVTYFQKLDGEKIAALVRAAPGNTLGSQSGGSRPGKDR